MRSERGGRKGRRAHTEPLIRLPGTAAGARYYRVYPKTVRRTVVLCRGGPMWPPTPGQPHRVAPTAAPALSGYERVQVGVFLLPPLPLLFPSPCPSPARGEGTQERPLHTNANRCNIFSLLWL